ncbi:MAG: DUF1214 domain-containing protein [Desulfatibacillaceae bacterium]
MKPFRPLFAIIAGVAAAFILLAGIMLYKGATMPRFNPNGWVYVPNVGSSDADMFVRAIIARIGLFANSPDQAVYMQAVEDRSIDLLGTLNGRPIRKLHPGGHYRIVGESDIDAWWWSVTLYNDEEYLFDNPLDRYSYAGFQLEREPDGGFVIDVAPERPKGATNWLPSPADRPFVLTLRIYWPNRALLENPGTYDLPRVVRMS